MYKISVPTIVTNGHFNKEKTLKELKRCKADRIVLAVDREMGHAFTSPENLKLLEELIAYYEANGLETMVWLGETLGHEPNPAREDSPYQNIRLMDGEYISAFCPLGENFIEDFCTWVKNIAKCGAKMIMLDDDFRLSVRRGAQCCCDLHMAKIREELGEDITLEDLRQKVFSGGRNRYRDAWLKAQSDSLKEFARRLREAVDTVSPDVRLSYCTVWDSWDTEGHNAVELAKIFAGNTAPFMRSIGAPYWKSTWGDPPLLGTIIENERMQYHWCKDEEIEMFTEGDTYPRPRFSCPSAHLECFDTIFRADGNPDGMLKYMLDYVSDAEYETGYVDAMIENEALYADIDRIFSNKKATGIRPYMAQRLLRDAELNGKNTLDGFGPRQAVCDFTTLLSLPTSYEAGPVNIVFGENARHIPEEDLNNGNILDFTAAKILMERGCDVGIQSILDRQSGDAFGFTDVPHEYFIGEDQYTRLNPGKTTPYVDLMPGAEVLSTIRENQKTDARTLSYRYESPDGRKYLVFLFDAMSINRAPGWFGSYARRRQVIDNVPWLSGKPLEAYPEGNHPLLYCMTKKNAGAISVGLWNMFDDKIKNLRIALNTECREIEFINCSGHLEGNTVVLDGTLYPYEFAGFEAKYVK
ncbi:MAG: hypothetical protein IKU17_00150 [Clostridia bacterium]|nr:hypothetical protein [Clostridia bacterium]